MSNTEKKNCYDCEYYMSSVGENGYCKLYRHETTMPEIACPRHEEKSKAKPEVHEIKISGNKTTFKRNESFLALASFFACTVLTVIFLMFALYFTVTVYSMPYFSIPSKALILIVTLAAIFLITFLLFTAGKKYMLMRLIELFLTVFVVVFVLIKYETIWFQFHGLVVKIIDLLFNTPVFYK